MFNYDVLDIDFHAFSFDENNVTYSIGSLDDEVTISQSKNTCRFEIAFFDGKLEMIIRYEDGGYYCRIPEWYGSKEVFVDRFVSDDGEKIIFKGEPAIKNTIMFEFSIEM